LNKFPLTFDGIKKAEKSSAIKSLLSGKYTMGDNVQKFEKLFAKWVGAKHAVMVNSGSSANLLIIESLLRGLKKKNLRRDDEIIVPALSWPTTIWPVIQLGLKPVFVDSNNNDLSIDFRKLQGAVTKRTKAIFLIHVLGNAANMEQVKSFCKKNKLILLEDCCESLGAFYKKKHVGTFGLAGSFSFYFAHHMTTIEGGCVVTNDKDLADDLRSFRAHGWIRNRSDQSKIIKKYKNFDKRFLFLTSGYNFRMTEFQACIGLIQLKKLNSFLKLRDQLSYKIKNIISKFKDLEIIGSEKIMRLKINNKKERKHSWMNIPLYFKGKSKKKLFDIIKIFEKTGIETRPIIAGNLLKHPALKKIKYRIGNNLTVANNLFNNGFMIGCHPGINHSSLQLLKKAINNICKLR
jgi:CDP-6-deoxy-D-xylo-4-hexulose-3-dehydrase